MTRPGDSPVDLTAGFNRGARWLVIGSAGQVGGALCELLGDHAVPSARRGEFSLDLEVAARDQFVVRDVLTRAEPDVVVLAAAMANVEGCEDNETTAVTLNTDAPRALAAGAAAAGVPVIYLSTDYVFDGTAGPYCEDDAPRPLSVYGRSKLAGERAVLEASGENLVVRTSVVYGPEEHGRNFAYRLVSELLAGRELAVPLDQIGSPTYNRDLARGIVAAVTAGRRGVVHLVGPDLCDRAHFARRLASRLGLDTRLIRGVATADLGQRAPRALRAGLRSAAPMPARSVESAVDDWRARPRGRPWIPSAAPESVSVLDRD